MAKKEVKTEDVKKPISDVDMANRWHDRISVSRKVKERKAQEYRWEIFIKEYKGKYEITLGSRKGRIPVPPINLVFVFVQSDKANMSFRDPYITVVPKKNGTVKGAAILEAKLNYDWRELKIKQEIEAEMTDADLVGHGWHKDGYNFDIEGADDTVKIKDKGIFSKYVSWRDIFFDTNARKPPKDCAWISERIVRPLDLAKEQYPVLKDLEGGKNPYLLEGESSVSKYPEDYKVAVFHEVWDAVKREKFLLCEGYKGYVKPPVKWPDYMNEFPHTMLWYYECPDEAYPMSPIAPQEDPILEINKLLAQALNHVKRWNRQGFYRTGSLTEPSLDKYEEGVDGGMIPADIPASQPIGDIIKFADYGTLPPDIYSLLDRLQQFLRQMSGQPEFEQGGVTKTGTRTLGELEQIATGAKGRLNRRIDMLETHIENIARHHMAHIKASFDTEQIAKVVDETPEEIINAFGANYDKETGIVKFSPEEIMGEYDTEVKAGSTLPMTREVRLATLKETLELAVNLASQGGQLPNWIQVIVMELLRDYQMPQLKAAFEQDQADAEMQAAQEDQGANIEKAKTAAEMEKRKAQANQIDAETMKLEMEIEHPGIFDKPKANGVKK